MKPARTFPVVRDLVVVRSRMFDALKKVKAWIPIDGTYDLGPGPRMPEKIGSGPMNCLGALRAVRVWRRAQT